MFFLQDRGLNQIASVTDPNPPDILIPASMGRLDKRTTQSNAPLFTNGIFNNSISLLDWINNGIADGDIVVPPGGTTTVITGLAGTIFTTTVNGVSDTTDLATISGTPTLTNGQIFVGDATNTAASVGMSGDVSITNTGVTTVIAGSETQAGKLELATAAETTAGTSTTLAVHPAGLKVELDKKADSTLTNGNIYIGDATNTAVGVTMSGDVTIDNAGVTDIANSGVTANTYGGTLVSPQIAVQADGRITSAADVNIATMVGATALAAGVQGFVPQPLAGDENAFLKGDGTWGAAPGSTYTASTTNNLLGIDITGTQIGLDINGLADVGNPADDDMLAIYDDGTTTNRKVSADHFLPKNLVHITETAVAPATAGQPTLAEIQAAVTTAGYTDRAIKYTGTDTSTDAPTYTYWADRAGIVLPMDKPSGSGSADGYHKAIVRTNNTPNVAPTTPEYGAPIDGSSAVVELTDGSVEHWNFDTAWGRQFTQRGNGRNYLMSGVNIVTSDDWGSDTQITMVTDGAGNTTVTIPEGIEHFDAHFPIEVVGETAGSLCNITFVFQGTRVYNQSNVTMRYPEVDFINRDNEAFNSFDIQDEGIAPQIRYQDFATAGEIDLTVQGTNAANVWTIKVRF